MNKPDLFTAIVITYNRLPLLKETVAALQRQTHENIEIIVVNNGCTDGTFEYLNDLAESDDRVKVLHLEENPWSINDPHKPYVVSGNAGLEISTGDYVLLNFDDDYIADDYAEKMVALFENNPECTTAIGRTINMDPQGNINRQSNGNLIEEPRATDFRSRYMPGRLLALEVLPGRQTMFGAQPCMFTVRRDVLVEIGGYHRSVDLGHLCGIVPFGETGFDDTAYFYWRLYVTVDRLRPAVVRNIIRVNETNSMIKEWEIQRRWRVFGGAMAKDVISRLRKRIYDSSAQWFIRLVYSLHFMLAFYVLLKMGSHRRFWLALPMNAFHSNQTRWLMLPARPLVKTSLRRVFRLMPGLARLSPRLARINERVGRE
jgi:glycosyltransferase involved in cell wall biosynthesis